MINKLRNDVKLVIAKYGTADPFSIIDKIGITIRWAPFMEQPLGQTYNFHGRPQILLADSLRESPERYFVCAHELGHTLEHADLTAYYTTNTHGKGKTEMEADKFAITLLTELFVEDNNRIPTNWGELVNSYGFPTLNDTQII